MATKPKRYEEAGAMLRSELRARDVTDREAARGGGIATSTLKKYLSGHSAPKLRDPIHQWLQELIGEEAADRYVAHVTGIRIPAFRKRSWAERVNDLIAKGRLAEAQTSLGLSDPQVDSMHLADCYQNLGRAWFDRSALDPAMTSYRRAQQALEIAPEATESSIDNLIREYAARLHGLERYEEAEEVLNERLKVRLRAGTLWRRLGATLWYANRLTQAYSALQSALDVGHAPARVFHARGQVLAEMGQYEQAAEELTIAIAHPLSDMSRSYAESCLAYVHFRQGEHDRALSEFGSIEATTPRNGWLHYRWGLCLDDSNHEVEALALLRRSLEGDSPVLNPTKRQDARERIARIMQT